MTDKGEYSTDINNRIFNKYSAQHKKDPNNQIFFLMSRRPEKTFIQRGHADGQQAHEKMLSTANHQFSSVVSHVQLFATP